MPGSTDSASNRRSSACHFEPDHGFGRDTAGDGGLAKSIYNNFGVSLNIDWEIDLWGRIRASQSAAIAEWQAADAEQGGLKTSLSAQTAKVWFAIQEAEPTARAGTAILGQLQRVGAHDQ